MARSCDAVTLESACASVPRLSEQPPIEELFALAAEEHAAHVREEMGEDDEA
jgi:hypothetical protein